MLSVKIMTDKDREKWDSKYLKRLGGTDPSLILMKHWGLAACGNALDLACGNGRNSIFLAQKGFAVDAVDISTVATKHLAGRHPKVKVICQDIDDWEIPQNRYDLILNIRFLDRRLFPMIRVELATAINAVPISANTASHMVAIPMAPNSIKMPLTVNARTIFCQTIRRV